MERNINGDLCNPYENNSYNKINDVTNYNISLLVYNLEYLSTSYSLDKDINNLKDDFDQIMTNLFIRK